MVAFSNNWLWPLSILRSMGSTFVRGWPDYSFLGIRDSGGNWSCCRLISCLLGERRIAEAKISKLQGAIEAHATEILAIEKDTPKKRHG